jgi:hypothetical protein
VQTTHHVKFHKHTFPAKILDTCAPIVSDSNLFTISIDEALANETSGEDEISEQTGSTKESEAITETTSNESTEDMDFFDSNSLIPNNAETNLNTIDQEIATQPLRNGPIHEIIGDVCEQDIVTGCL